MWHTCYWSICWWLWAMYSQRWEPTTIYFMEKQSLEYGHYLVISRILIRDNDPIKWINCCKSDLILNYSQISWFCHFWYNFLFSCLFYQAFFLMDNILCFCWQLTEYIILRTHFPTCKHSRKMFSLYMCQIFIFCRFTKWSGNLLWNYCMFEIT